MRQNSVSPRRQPQHAAVLPLGEFIVRKLSGCTKKQHTSHHPCSKPKNGRIVANMQANVVNLLEKSQLIDKNQRTRIYIYLYLYFISKLWRVLIFRIIQRHRPIQVEAMSGHASIKIPMLMLRSLCRARRKRAYAKLCGV